MRVFKSKSRKSPRTFSSQRSSSSLTSDYLSRRHKPDYILIVIALLLSVVGLIVVYAISPGLAASRHVDGNYFVTKQAISIGLGLLAFAICSSIGVDFLKKTRNALLIISAIGVVIIQAVGEQVNGAARWIQIGGLSFQVAEMVKFTLIVWLAIFLVERMKKGEMSDNNKTLKPLMIAMLLIGVFVAVLQSDLGSSGVMIAILGIMAFTAGLPWQRLAMILGIVAVGTLLAISTSSYRRDRVATYLNPTADCQAAGYQSCQALIAVGSGGMFGLGLGKSVQAYGYLPEPANDSIFAVLAEKFGFLGVTIVIGLFVLLFSRFKRIIERTADPFSRLFVIGTLAWLSTQTIINMGAMIGLLPLKGITLPFISYGGTSILFVMAALGVVFQISRYTSFEPIRQSKAKEEPRGSRVRQLGYASVERKRSVYGAR